MNAMRHLARGAFLGVMLACALAFSGLAGARLAGEHTAHRHASAGLKVICAEHGLIPPGQNDHEHPHKHHDCPACLASKAKPIGVVGQVALNSFVLPRTAATISYFSPPFVLANTHAPPGLSARGPPRLV